MERLSVLGDSEAVKHWNEIAPELGVAIIGIIRKMGLPASKAGPLGQEVRKSYSGLGKGEIRMILLRDRQLHEDILQEVADAFWEAIRRRRVVADTARGWLFRVTQRTTWRTATERARTLLLVAEPVDENVDVEMLADVESSNYYIDRELIAYLKPELETLTEIERRLLTAKLENSYDELASELGLEVGTIRVRAHRLCKRLRTKLLSRINSSRSKVKSRICPT